jgi:hypothetical protein
MKLAGMEGGSQPVVLCRNRWLRWKVNRGPD